MANRETAVLLGRRLTRAALIGAMVAIFGMAAIPSASYSKETVTQHLRNGLKACEKEKSKSKREACEKKARHCYCSLSPREEERRHREAAEREERKQEEALSATIIVHTIACGVGEEKKGQPQAPPCGPLQNAAAVRITRLGLALEHLGSVETAGDTAHVEPGRYEVQAIGTVAQETQVTVVAGQTLEVTLQIKVH